MQERWLGDGDDDDDGGGARSQGGGWNVGIAFARVRTPCFFFILCISLCTH
jgi:hypothetical protein